MTVNTDCSRECINYISRYSEVQHTRDIALAAYKQACDCFDEERKGELRQKIGEYEATLKDIEHLCEEYSPRDVKPYKGHDFGLERLCLHCCYILGVGYERAAEIMDVSRATVYRVMKYIKKSCGAA